MNTNETLYTILSLTFLTFLVIRFFNISSNSFDTTSNSQAILSAVGLGQSLIEEITLRKFDERTVNNEVDSTNNLTNTQNLGPDLYEIALNDYNDIDDFNGYTKIDSLAGMGEFRSTARIYYVAESNINDSTHSPSFLKKITVVTTNQFLPGSVKLEYIVNY